MAGSEKGGSVMSGKHVILHLELWIVPNVVPAL